MPQGQESRCDYVLGMVELGLWHAHRLGTAGGRARRPLRDVLSRHVDLYRLTTLWDGVRDVASGHRDGRWDEIVATLDGLAHGHPTEVFVAHAAELLTPLLSFASEATPADAIGCWSGVLVGRGIADSHRAPHAGRQLVRIARAVRRRLGIGTPPGDLELHFHNAAAPRSPFATPGALAADLARLVTRVRTAHPGVHTVWCNTWLNDCERFLALFPPEWRASGVVRTPADVDRDSRGRARLNTRNWWGQFERADGTFHRAHAASFRATGGVFPHPCRLCRAPIGAVEEHLTRLARHWREEARP
ncbi:MAG: hypothetical protein U1E73_12745 [Planctomycetota bacterium]